ncbi:MAG: hypothetical protein HYY17_16270 [Planctomycetes bacterium]|nr:hypothetical protein [Planctomycetota bacterium]
MNALMLADLAKAQEGFYGAGAFFFLLASAALAAAAVGGVLAMTLVVTPSVTQRCAEALRARSLLCFVAGLPFVGLFVVFAAVGKKLPAVGALGVLALAVFAFVGLAAASEDVGRRLFWACGREGSRAAHLLAGWTLFFLSACVPFVGWFVILPYVLLSGLGSILVGAFRSEPAPARA